MKLSQLLEGSAQDLKQNREILSVENDSRKVGKDSLFVAYSSYVPNSHPYVGSAYNNGCRTFVVSRNRVSDFEKKYPNALWFGTDNLPLALADISACFYNHPSKAFRLVGITGTNGKTTTATAVYQSLMKRGISAGLVGTIDYRIGSTIFPTGNTTPDVLELNRILRQMADIGLEVVVMEVSSHALSLGRVLGLRFAVAAFTNLTQDHLDFHHTMQEYVNAKKRLITLLAQSQNSIGSLLLNRQMDFYEDVFAEAQRFPNINVKTYAIEEDADYTAKVQDLSASHTLFEWNGQKLKIEMIGLPNVANVTLAAAILAELGQNPVEFLPTFSDLHVNGRVERVKNNLGIHVFIDYAHTPDALKNVLKTLLTVKDKENRLICVFGAGGDRDRSKRPLMAQAAAKYANFLIITSDNPRTENPEAILNEIVSGLEGVAINYDIEENRKKAIFKALSQANKGDIVLIAGKGHENYQIIGKVKHHFSDCEVAEEFFTKQRETG